MSEWEIKQKKKKINRNIIMIAEVYKSQACKFYLTNEESSYGFEPMTAPTLTNNKNRFKMVNVPDQLRTKEQ